MFVKFQVYNETNSVYFLFRKHCWFPVSLLIYQRYRCFHIIGQVYLLGSGCRGNLHLRFLQNFLADSYLKYSWIKNRLHIHKYIHIHTHTYIYTYIHTHKYIHTYTHTYTHKIIHTHTHTHAYIHTCVRTYVHQRVHVASRPKQ